MIHVTGANGFVGKNFIKLLNARSIQHQVVERLKNTELDLDEFHLNDDAHHNSVLVHLAARVHVMNDTSENPLDVFLASNLYATMNLVQKAHDAGFKRFVYVSSVKVNGECTKGHPFTESDKPKPQDPYAVSKWKTEEALRHFSFKTDMEIVIIRPPLIYGPEVKANFLNMLNVIYRNVPLPFASISNSRSLIFVHNLTDVLLLCATHSDAPGKTYLVSDGESVSTPKLLHELAKGMGKKCRAFPFPIFVIKLIARIMGKSAPIDRLTQSLQIDDSKIHNELGWKPPFSLQQGLAETAQWYKSQQKK